ncbi:Piso0_005536 [Millerozyma farinosa CBS 7064]|uniref:Piso0_005536 protein n=1 Tax=Pichia sorbitophila (strain ATCC MYA-4447 / BCRC 22081 / CBS 7064 / NBRC 10061 / NRRL Y-12695) TaxID=559304 RepID=G8XZA1_PICSO|nr:Piso0_005536 [Millerozyma farinosa CBS 7064]
MATTPELKNEQSARMDREIKVAPPANGKKLWRVKKAGAAKQSTDTSSTVECWQNSLRIAAGSGGKRYSARRSGTLKRPKNRPGMPKNFVFVDLSPVKKEAADASSESSESSDSGSESVMSSAELSPASSFEQQSQSLESSPADNREFFSASRSHWEEASFDELFGNSLMLGDQYGLGIFSCPLASENDSEGEYSQNSNASNTSMPHNDYFFASNGALHSSFRPQNPASSSVPAGETDATNAFLHIPTKPRDSLKRAFTLSNIPVLQPDQQTQALPKRPKASSAPASRKASGAGKFQFKTYKAPKSSPIEQAPKNIELPAQQTKSDDISFDTKIPHCEFSGKDMDLDAFMFLNDQAPSFGYNSFSSSDDSQSFEYASETYTPSTDHSDIEDFKPAFSHQAQGTNNILNSCGGPLLQNWQDTELDNFNLISF